MDKKTAMENLVREAHEKGLFNGTWLYVENSKRSDPEVIFNNRGDSYEKCSTRQGRYEEL